MLERKYSFMEFDISRSEDVFGMKIQQFVGFLAIRIAKKNTGFNSTFQLVPMSLLCGSIT